MEYNNNIDSQKISAFFDESPDILKLTSSEWPQLDEESRNFVSSISRQIFYHFQLGHQLPLFVLDNVYIDIAALAEECDPYDKRWQNSIEFAIDNSAAFCDRLYKYLDNDVQKNAGYFKMAQCVANIRMKKELEASNNECAADVRAMLEKNGECDSSDYSEE